MAKPHLISAAIVTAFVATALSLAACGGGYGSKGGGGGYSSSSSVPGAAYKSRDLAADLAAPGVNVDANLQNAWGIAITPTGVVMVTQNAVDKANVYNDVGTVQSGGLSVPGLPTGVVYNNTTAFSGTFSGVNDRTVFIFATDTGKLSVLPATVGVPAAVQVFDGGAGAADYKGLTMVTGAVNALYAADFHNQRIDVFDSAFNRVPLPGKFTDTAIPADFAPFNVQALNGQIYVAYARKAAAANTEVAGAGLGYVDVFDTAGTLVKRLVSGGALNAPFGLALAPANFGPFSNALLVGNAGDGKVNAYDASTGAMLGTVSKIDGAPIVIPGLHGIAFNTNILFYAAGSGTHGAYGRIDLY